MKPRTSNFNSLAYVTFLMFNDSYLPGCLMAAYGLNQQQSSADRICMVTKGVTGAAMDALRTLYDRVIHVSEIGVQGSVGTKSYIPPKTGSARVDDAALTRFASLRLGPDGDLGAHYDRVVNIDADLLPVRDFDEIWATKPPAGIINERRDHIADFDPSGNLVPIPAHSKIETWAWHEVYGHVCPPGAPIPRHITNRVRTDPSNFGVNASVLLLEPSLKTFDRFTSWISEGTPNRLARELWPWTDQQAATLFWSGRWTSLDPAYSLFYGYPNVHTAKGLHYAGVKPWSWRKRGFQRRLTLFQDYRLWAMMYLDMIQEYPEFRSLRGLRKLENAILTNLAG